MRMCVWESERLREADLSCRAFRCFFSDIYNKISLFRVTLLVAYLANILGLWGKHDEIYSVQHLIGAL